MEFFNKPWTLPGLDKLLWKTDTEGTAERKPGSGRKRTVSKNEEFIDEAVKQWRPRLRACIRARRGHFEDFDIYIRMHFDSNMSVRCRTETIAGVDKYYLNLMIYLQLNVTLLIHVYSLMTSSTCIPPVLLILSHVQFST